MSSFNKAYTEVKTDFKKNAQTGNLDLQSSQ